MKKDVATIGLILVFIAAVLFYIVFSGGQFLGITVTGTNATANFIAFFYVIAALPIGSGLAYFGLSFKTPTYAAGGPTQVVYKSSSVGSAAIAVAVIALIIAFAAIGIMYSNAGSQSSRLSSVSSQVASLNSKVANVASVNVAPSAVAVKVDWCNTDNTGQDRFCPSTIVVNQGDIVQILFMHNDTDAHTFTLDTAPYFFQINDSSAGMHNFLTDQYNSGNCSNSGTIAQQQAGISDIYCVSGNSLLSTSTLKSNGANDFVIGQNPIPTNPLTGGPIILSVNNQVNFVNASSAAISAGSTEIWGIGAFQATSPGVFEYFCHYHVSNGMFGYLVVLPNAYCGTNPTACNVTSSA
jgi:plastocyanin